MKYLRCIHFFIILIMAHLSVDAQTIVSRSLMRQEEGLSAREAIKVVRDSFGFFYVTTDVDIMRFDGNEFSPVNIDKLFSNQVESTNIKSLSQGPHGKIILRTEPRRALLFIEPGSLAVSEIKFGVAMEFIVSDKSLFGIQRSGSKYNIYKIDWAKKIVCTKVFESQFKPLNVCVSGTQYFIETEEGIYIASGKNLVKSGEKGSIINFQDGILMSNREKIIFYKDDKFKQIFSFPNDSASCKIIKADKKGNVVLGYSTTPRYIENFYIVSADLKVKNYPSLTEGIKISQDIYTDDVNHMWIMSGHQGVLSIGLLRDGARFVSQRPYLKDETFGSVITGIASDEKGNMLYAIESKDLIYMDVKTGKSRILFPELNEGRGSILNGKIYYDKAGKTFYSLNYSMENHSYFNRIEPEKNKIVTYRLPFQALDFTVLKNGKVLICGGDNATRQGILVEFDLRSGTYRTLLNDPALVATIFYEAENETYWVGTVEGLYVMDKNFRQLVKFDSYQSDPNKFLQHSNINIIERYNELLMVGTRGGGVYGIDPVNFKVVRHMTDRDGIADNKVVGALKDKFGNCWIPTYKGITVIDAKWKVISEIYEQDGLPNKELNTKAYAVDPVGNLYFGTVNGMVIMDPAKVLNWKKSHGFFVNDIQVRYENKTEVLRDNTFKSNFISATINYIKPDYIHNIYDNLPPGIIHEKGLKTQITNHNILINDGEPGTYTLGVSFEGIKGKINLPLIIKRDHTKTLIVIAVIVFGILLIQIFRLRKKNLVQKENAIKNRIAILELEALQAQMNPHFMFNALGSIQYFIQTENIEKADDYLSDFALLMRMILESSHHKFIAISHEIKLLELYVSLEQIRFGSRFQYKFEIDKNVDVDFQIPPMITQPFIENAINHGINNLIGKTGLLEVNVSVNEDASLLIMIRDNGVGRMNTLNKVHKHKSRGTQIVMERVATLNSTAYFNVSIETKDLMEEELSAGTEVNIIFKHKPIPEKEVKFFKKSVSNAI